MSEVCNYHRLTADQIRCESCGHTRRWNRPDTLPKRTCTWLLQGTEAPPRTGCGGCGKGPSLAEKAWNLAGAIGRFVREPGFATAEQYAARLEICHRCNRRDDTTCRECGCIVSLKARLATEDCPIGRWHPNAGNWWHDQGRVTYKTAEPLPPARRVLLSFRHGLGDNVFFAGLLRQLRRDRPDLAIDLQVWRYNARLFEGLADNIYFHDQPAPEAGYDLRHSYVWPEPSEAFPDARSHKAGKALWEVHRLMPDPQALAYSVPFASSDVSAASDYLDSVAFARNGRFRAVLIHHQGATSKPFKDIPDGTARRLSDAVIAAGRVPIVLDWSGESPLLRRSGVQNPGAGHALWHGWKLADPCRLAALASLCELCIGIDSGPGHVFQGVPEANAVVVWTRHHPIAFGSPHKHALNLVPTDHAANAYGPRSVWGDYFERHFRYRLYDDLGDELAALIQERLT